MTSMKFGLLEFADWRSLAVLRRNARVYLRNWRTAFFPPAMEPLVYFAAFGLGLSGYVDNLHWRGRALPYTTYVAPGLVAYAAFNTSFYEALYSSYVRMFYQKTWDGILGTQVELRHIVWGEVLWAGSRAFMNTSFVALALALVHALGLVHLRLEVLPLLPLLGVFAGWAFAAFGLIFTAVVPSIDHMNYPVFLIGIPIALLSNTYFPVPTHNPWVGAIAQLNPVFHLSETLRSLLVDGELGPSFLPWLLSTTAALLLFIASAQYLIHRRLLRK